MKKVTVEYCVGIGSNMLFPEYLYHTFFVEYDEDELRPFDLIPNPSVVTGFPTKELEDA